jgi:hypothetical protein
MHVEIESLNHTRREENRRAGCTVITKCHCRNGSHNFHIDIRGNKIDGDINLFELMTLPSILLLQRKYHLS